MPFRNRIFYSKNVRYPGCFFIEGHTYVHKDITDVKNFMHWSFKELNT